MLFKYLERFLAVAVLALASTAAHAAPCDATGRLCASMLANTSLVAAAQQPSQAAGAPVELPPAPVPVKPPPLRIGLMLPLRSETLGGPAEAVLAGFMAAYERDRDGFVVNVIETGDTVPQALEAYATAVAANDLVVGPLARSAVGAIAASPAATKPTIALNVPDSKTVVPPQMLVMGLSIEDEARQVASWAHVEFPKASVLVISSTNAWQKRIAGAFAGLARSLGHAVQLSELPASNGYLSESAINQLKLKVEAEPPGMLFAALDADQLRQVRGMIAADLPFFSTSSANPGVAPGLAMAELDGLRLLDLPWLVQSDNPSVMTYPRRNGATMQLDLDRLYALGIDAFRVARELSKKPEAPVRLDGVTGRLLISFGQGPSRFERQQPAVLYQGGAYKAAAAGR